MARIDDVGTYRIVLDTGPSLDLENCLYVPEYSTNLVFVSRLDVLGFELSLDIIYFSLYHFNLNSSFANSIYNV